MLIKFYLEIMKHQLIRGLIIMYGKICASQRSVKQVRLYC